MMLERCFDYNTIPFEWLLLYLLYKCHYYTMMMILFDSQKIVIFSTAAKLQKNKAPTPYSVVERKDRGRG
jgi:hypothetical protein